MLVLSLNFLRLCRLLDLHFWICGTRLLEDIVFFLIKTNRNKWFPFCKSDEELPGAGRLGTNQQKPPSTGRSRPEHLKRS